MTFSFSLIRILKWLNISQLDQIENEWPNQRKVELPGTRAYFSFRDELSVQDSMIFRGDRVIVQVTLGWKSAFALREK